MRAPDHRLDRPGNSRRHPPFFGTLKALGLGSRPSDDSLGLAFYLGLCRLPLRFACASPFDLGRVQQFARSSLGLGQPGFKRLAFCGERNLWERFSRYDLIAPGRASAGNVHFAPNSERDYDWGNPRSVSSDCDDWLNFPNQTGARRMVDCRDWGNGDIRLHHLWWLERLPHAEGQTDGIHNTWWTYVVDPNTVRNKGCLTLFLNWFQRLSAPRS
jgi:hypothetical protein